MNDSEVETVLSFLEWLDNGVETDGMVLAGPVTDPLLGTDRLVPLDKRDYRNVALAFGRREQ